MNYEKVSQRHKREKAGADMPLSRECEVTALDRETPQLCSVYGIEIND